MPSEDTVGRSHQIKPLQRGWFSLSGHSSTLEKRRHSTNVNGSCPGPRVKGAYWNPVLDQDAARVADDM
jgi:hypothetical protein